MDDSGQLVTRFELGAHRVEVRRHGDASLSLWLDACLRKRRGAGGGPVWLWTNVELPFEDHHLVEVRRAEGDADAVDVRVNGAPIERPPSAS